MRVVFVGVILAAILFSPTATLACTCTVSSLSKRFRMAEAIFIGRLADIQDEPSPQVQNHGKGLPVLEVVKAFKGVRKEYVAVNFNFDGATGGGSACPWLWKFEKDAEYLVFAYGKTLKVEVECSDTARLNAKYDHVTGQISRLDNFWFRTRARLWPF